MNTLNQVKVISVNSLNTALADPSFFILQLCSLGGLGVLAAIPGVSLDEHTRFVRDQSLSFVFMALCACATFAVLRVYTDDIRRGAGDILFSRPVSKGAVICGKFLGIVAVMLLSSVSLGCGYLWLSKVNQSLHGFDNMWLAFYFLSLCVGIGIAAYRQVMLKRRFTAFANICTSLCLIVGLIIYMMFEGSDGIDFAGREGVYYLFMASLIFAAMLVPVAISLDSAGVIASAILLFFLGLLSEYTIKQLCGEGLLYDCLSSALPNWQNFWVLDSIAAKKIPSTNYFITALMQVALQCTLYISAALMLFSRKEIKVNQ